MKQEEGVLSELGGGEPRCEGPTEEPTKGGLMGGLALTHCGQGYAGGGFWGLGPLALFSLAA